MDIYSPVDLSRLVFRSVKYANKSLKATDMRDQCPFAYTNESILTDGHLKSCRPFQTRVDVLNMLITNHSKPVIIEQCPFAYTNEHYIL